MPPIQRAIGEHPLTAPPDRFRDDLATRHDPSVATATMGHHVTADAPSGMVLAVARPTTRSDGPAMVSRPRVQRRATAGTEPELDSIDSELIESPSPTPAPPSVQTLAAPRRELPIVSEPSPVQRLTELAADAEPVPAAPPARRSRNEPAMPLFQPQGPTVQTTPAPAAPHLTLGQSRRMGLGAPLSTLPPTGVAPDSLAMPLARTPSAPGPPAALPVQTMPAAPTPVVASPAPGPHAPMVPGDAGRVESSITTTTPSAALAPIVRVSRTAATSDATRLQLPLVPSPSHADASQPVRVSRAAEDEPAAAAPGNASAPDEDLATSTSAPEPSTIETSPRPGSTQRLVQGPAGELLTSAPAEPASDTAVAPVSGPRLPFSTSRLRATETRTNGGMPEAPPAGRPANLAPLVGSKPLRPMTSIQRATETAPTDVAGPIGRAVETDLSGARVDRGQGAEQLADAMGARAFTQGDETVLPSTHGPLDGTPARSLLAHELTHVAQERRLRGTPPSEGSPSGRRLELQAQAVEHSWSRPNTLPLAPLSAPVQRAAVAEAPVEDEADPSVQRAWYDSVSSGISSMTSNAPSASGIASSASSAVSSMLPSLLGGGKHDEKDMDELAGKLYDRIRARLKSELLVDRERAGFLTDLR